MKKLLLCIYSMLFFVLASAVAFAADIDMPLSPPTGDIDLMIIIGAILLCAFIIFIIVRQMKNGKDK